MAASTNKTTSRANGNGTEPPPPAYFLSLTVENVRCFSERQTLDLSDGKDRPRQWTILLGDNGVGKTTLLRCLAALQPIDYATISGGPTNLMPNLVYLEGIWGREQYSFLKLSENSPFYLQASIVKETELNSMKVGVKADEWAVTAWEKSVRLENLVDDVEGLICYGYGVTCTP